MLALEILIILLLILVNGFFSAAELAVVSSRKIRLQMMAAEGDRSATSALQLAEHPNAFLATVQIGITLVATLASAVGGARVSLTLQQYLARWPWLEPYSASVSLGIVVLSITYLSLVLGELAPKRLALRYPERYARRIAGPFLGLSGLARPIVRFLTWSSRLVVKLLAGEHRSEPSITEEEIEAVLEAGAESGAIEQSEQEFMQSILDLADTQVRTIMVPRTAIFGVDADQPLNAVISSIVQSGFSRVPVYRGDLDHVIGMLNVKDLIGLNTEQHNGTVAQLVRPTLFATEGMSVSRLLETFKRHRAYMAIVLDEYGGTAGLATVQDILEEIVGDLDEEQDDTRPLIRRQSSGCWIADGLTPIEDLKDLLNVKHLPGQEEYAFETVGGMLLAQLGHIPKPGEGFSWRGYRFQVAVMDRHRVAQVMISRLAGPTGSRPAASCPPEAGEVAPKS